jgi:hypothetical protein
MQVQNFECQIAQSQMARYLSGESFSPEAVRQLNEHISGCVSCKSALAQRRASLQDQISRRSTPSAASPKAVIEAPTPEPREVVVSVEEQTATTKNFTKPLLLSSALAVVLVGMTVITRDPTTLFGQRASQAAPSTTPPKKGLVSPAAPVVASKRSWSGSVLAASLRQAFIAAAAAQTQGVAPAKVPVDQLKPLTGVASKGPGIGGRIGDVGTDGYPQVTVYTPAGHTPAITATRVDPPKTKKISNPRPKAKPSNSPRQTRAVVVYDSNGAVISQEGKTK